MGRVDALGKMRQVQFHGGDGRDEEILKKQRGGQVDGREDS